MKPSKEIIEQALHSTGHFSWEECSDLSNDVLDYFKSVGVFLKKKRSKEVYVIKRCKIVAFLEKSYVIRFIGNDEVFYIPKSQSKLKGGRNGKIHISKAFWELKKEEFKMC